MTDATLPSMDYDPSDEPISINLRPEDDNLMPAVWRALVRSRFMSVHQLFSLSEMLGGQEIVFPRDPDPSSPIVSAVGLEGARTLGDLFVGRRIRVPTCARLRTVLLHRQIVREAAAGLDTAGIAERRGISERSIRAILAKGKP